MEFVVGEVVQYFLHPGVSYIRNLRVEHGDFFLVLEPSATQSYSDMDDREEVLLLHLPSNSKVKSCLRNWQGRPLFRRVDDKPLWETV